MKIFLANTPPWYPNQPYLSVPLLTGILRGDGYDVTQSDLNLEFYLFLLDKNRLNDQVRLLNTKEKELEDKEKDLLLLSDYLIENIEEAIKTFKNIDFYDREKFKTALEIVELCLKIYSITFKKTKVHLGDTLYNFNQYNFEAVFEYIENEGDNIFSYFFKNFFIEKYNEKEFDVFALSVTTSQQLIPALSFAKMIKSYSPKVKIVFGGDIITRLKNKLSENDKIWEIIDYIIYSFGEKAFGKLLGAIDSKMSLDLVPNLIFSRENKRILNPESKNFSINETPFPDFDGLPLKKYLSPQIMLPVEFSKGCYWGKCTFCEIVGMPYKVKKSERMAKEMQYLQEKYNTSAFTIVDSASPPAKLVQLASIISKAKKPIYWRTMIKAEKYFTKENSKLLFNGGCRLVMIGVESGNQRVLNAMEKGVSVADVENTIQNLSNSGIWVHNFYMFKFPTETYEEANETLQFIEKNMPYLKSVSASKFILPKESPIYKDLEKYTITELANKKENDLIIHHTRFNANTLTDNELQIIDDRYSEILTSNKNVNEYDDIHLNYYFLHSITKKYGRR